MSFWSDPIGSIGRTFSNVGSAAGNAAKTFVTEYLPYAVGGPVGGLLAGEIFGKDEQKAPSYEGPGGPGAASYLKPIADKQYEQARQFRANLPNYIKSQQEMARDEEMQGLQSNIEDVRQDAQKRGLLFSGLRERGEAGAAGAASKKIAQRFNEADAAAREKANKLESLSADSLASLQQLEQQQNDLAFQAAMARFQDKIGAFSSLSQGIGSVAGTAVSLGG